MAPQLDDITPRDFWTRMAIAASLILLASGVLWLGVIVIDHTSNKRDVLSPQESSQSSSLIRPTTSLPDLTSSSLRPTPDTTTTTALTLAILPHFEELLPGQPSVGIAGPDNGCTSTSFSIYNMTDRDQAVVMWANGQKFGPFVAQPNTLQTRVLSGTVKVLRIETDKAVLLADVDYRAAVCQSPNDQLALSEPYIESVRPVDSTPASTETA